MTGIQRRRILLVGLDDRVLWQLTRTLALWDDRIGYGCAPGIEEALDICGRERIDLLVLDSPESAARAAWLFKDRHAADRCPPAWLVLADEVPAAGLLIPGAPRSTLVVERPVHPKEFPLMVLKAFSGIEPREAAEKRPAPSAQKEGEPARIPAAGEGWPWGRPPMFPEERYAGPQAAEEPEEKEGERPPPAVPEAEPPPSGGFYELLAKGFECLKSQDRRGALENWKAALALKPDDRRLKANIARLEGTERTI